MIHVFIIDQVFAIFETWNQFVLVPIQIARSTLDKVSKMKSKHVIVIIYFVIHDYKEIYILEFLRFVNTSF